MTDDINMKDRLNQLESERQWFWDACPPDQRQSYDPASEQRLTRVVMEHIPRAYDEAVERVKTMVNYRKLAAGEIDDDYNHLRRQIDQNFNSDWLPQYIHLRSELIDTYEKLKKNKLLTNGQRTAPTMLQNSHQPGLQNIRCYGCGLPGHKRGDDVCKADSKAIHHSAPEAWKRLKRPCASGETNEKGSGNK